MYLTANKTELNDLFVVDTVIIEQVFLQPTVLCYKVQTTKLQKYQIKSSRFEIPNCFLPLKKENCLSLWDLFHCFVVPATCIHHKEGES